MLSKIKKKPENHREITQPHLVFIKVAVDFVLQPCLRQAGLIFSCQYRMVSSGGLFLFKNNVPLLRGVRGVFLHKILRSFIKKIGYQWPVRSKALGQEKVFSFFFIFKLRSTS